MCIRDSAHIRRVTRRAHADEVLTDHTTTDESGHFSMPAVFDRAWLAKFLPMEFSVPQEIWVTHEGKEHDIWSGVKSDRAENAESKGSPLVVSCDLQNERTSITVSGGTIFTLCRWDVEPDEEISFDSLPGPGQG